jgi:hypothetical protein
MNDATANSDGVDEFLMTISEVNDFLLNKGRRPQRIEVFQAIHARIADQLVIDRVVTEDLEYDWLSQLIELEFEGENLPDKASHIARLLTSYVVNRPWVFQSDIMRPKPGDLTYWFDPQVVISPRSNRDKNFVLDYENVIDLLNHRELTTNEASQVSHTMAERSHKDYLETINKKSEILEESDAILGIAGFFPFNRELEPQDKRASSANSTLNDSMDIEEEFISQYRRHVKLTRYSSRQCARISFVPYDAKDGQASEVSLMAHAKLAVEHGIRSLVSQINFLQEASGHIDRLLFIRSISSGNEISGTHYQYAEVSSIDMGTIKNFVHVYGETRETFDHCLKEALERPNLIPRFDTSFTNAAIVALTSLVSPFLGGLFITGTYLHQFTEHYFSRGRDRSVVKSLSPLLKTLEPILHNIGITQFNPRQASRAAAIEILHIVALTVQSLCLMIQSYLRESVTPLHFEYLTSPIYNFVLDGVSPQLQSRKIYARSQQLSCLGEMLKKDVLVFGSEWSFPLPEEQLDLVVTTAQIASIWGPAELVIKKNDELTVTNKRGLEEVTNTKSFISAHKMPHIIGIKIQGGIVVPTGETIRGMQQWHWRSLDTADKGEDVVIPNIHTGIDLHTQIRIGGFGSRLSLHPIGPATWNQDCPSSTKSILDLNPSFSSNFRVLGVKDPSISFKSATVGVQGGQFVNLFAQGNYEATLGKTIKDQAINSTAFFENHLAKYNGMWGLFVSLCTGVMTRVRLRELVAYFCLQCAVRDIPQLPGKSHEESVEVFTEALCGNDSLSDWFESLILKPVISESSIPEPEKKEWEKERAKEREELQERILSLFLRVLIMLKDTGVSENGDLVLACLSTDKRLNSLTLSATDHPWIKVLSDSSLTATFACLSLHCFQDRDCKCQNNTWSIPYEFRLATKLDIDRSSAFRPRDMQQDGLQVMTKYWINSSNLNLMARVAGCMRESGSDLLYYLTIKKSVLPINLVKTLRKRPTIREDDSPTAVKCIIGGGPKYCRELEKLVEEGNMETHSA